MNAFEVCLYELASLLERVGGFRSLAFLAILAGLTVILPLRFGAGLLNPLLLLVFTAIAPLLAGNFTARAFAAEKARAHILNDGDPARAIATGKVLAAAVWGLLTWAVLFSVPLIALDTTSHRLILPSARLLIALALFAFASAWLASALGSIFAADAANPAQAQTFVRGVILLPLVLLAITYSLVPVDLRLALARLLDSSRLPLALLAGSLGLILLGIPALRQTASKIDELRHPLSIVE
jgi:hypothetical protein